MYVVNWEKEIAKINLISNITGNIANVLAVANEIRDLISSINYIIGGAPSGKDAQLIGCCQRALDNLSRASGQLHRGRENAKELDITEWAPYGD